MREALHTDAREKSCAVLNFAPFDLLVCIVARSLEKYRSLSLVSFLARYRSLSLSLSLTGLIWTTCLNQFLDNFEETFFAIPRQCRGNVFRSKQPVCRSCNRPVEVVYRNTLIPVWFGHFWLATIWTCLNQFLDNVEEISSKISRKCVSQFLDNVEEIFFRSNQSVCRSCNRSVEVIYQNTLIPVCFGRFWLATIWTTCLNQFLDNFEEISSTISKKCFSQFLSTSSGPQDRQTGWFERKKISSTLSRNCEKHFLEIVEELIKTRPNQTGISDSA